MAYKMKQLDWIAMILLTAGGINWGLITWFDFDLVTFISFGSVLAENIIKSLVGVSGLYSIKIWLSK